MFKNRKPKLSDLQNRHGLVLQIADGTKKGAEKIADSIFDNGFCENKVDSIYSLPENVWIFAWKPGGSVQMPAIIKLANNIKINGVSWAVDTLPNFLKKHSDKLV